MGDARGEVELRIDGVAGDGDLDRVRAAVAELDSSASVRIDEATGIVHIETSCEVLELTAKLEGAGLTARAMTG